MEHKTMDTIRNEALDRAVMLADAANDMTRATGHLNDAATSVKRAWHGWHQEYRERYRNVEALELLTASVKMTVVHDAHVAAAQYGKLLARDVIAPIARESADPVAFITGNSHMPPLRAFDQCEYIWIADHNVDDLWSIFVEALEGALAEESVYMASPEDDNSLYVVDLKRWQYVDDYERQGDPGESINDEWIPVVSVH
jgi:hypothetical protein